ncbi:unnamed protein product, partial [Nesidiocoris tenuis]
QNRRWIQKGTQAQLSLSLTASDQLTTASKRLRYHPTVGRTRSESRSGRSLAEVQQSPE